MDKPMILYRGTLKSCNYRCSYCPFAKHPIGNRELQQDKARWLQFVKDFPDLAQACFPVPARALMVVPYGEALIHPWYWEGLGALSALPWMDAVGAQTNLSFSPETSLAIFRQAGGYVEKLRLWATFHPEMITAEAFAASCRTLLAAGVPLCAGAVGDPRNLEKIRLLRQELPKETYLWINRMDGLDRDYTQTERDEFLDIDPYFGRELISVPSEPARCGHRLFVEGNGQVRLCNISQAVGGRVWKPGSESDGLRLDRLCRRKRCSCYLAYGGRDDFMNRILFGPYPLFRIPRRPKAVFLDIQGTLFPQSTGVYPAKCGGVRLGEYNFQTPSDAASPAQAAEDFSTVPPMIRAGLEALHREGIPLFFATTLPYGCAMARCRGIRHLFSGGIFSAGAYIRLEQGTEVKERVYHLDGTYPEQLEPLKKPFRFRILPDRIGSRICKITLLRPRHLPWSLPEAEELAHALALPRDEAVRFFAEDCCLQIVPSGASKEQGVRTLCQWLGISPQEAAAAGDSGEDDGMMAVTGESAFIGSVYNGESSLTATFSGVADTS